MIITKTFDDAEKCHTLYRTVWEQMVLGKIATTLPKDNIFYLWVIHRDINFLFSIADNMVNPDRDIYHAITEFETDKFVIRFDPTFKYHPPYGRDIVTSYKMYVTGEETEIDDFLITLLLSL
jgi:hypothetical protein